MLIRISVVFLVSMAWSLSVHGAEPAGFDSVWGNAVADPVQACCTPAISTTANGDAQSILFSGDVLSLRTAGDPLSGMWAGRIRLPYGKKDQFKGNRIVTDFRMNVEKSKNSRVLIFIGLGSKRNTIEFPYGVAKSGAVNKRYVQIADIVNLAHHSIAVSIVAERKSVAGAVLVSLDSIDVCLKRPVQNSVCR